MTRRLTNATFVAWLKSCAKKKDLYNGERLHRDILETQLLENSPYLASSLIDMYTKCGALVKAVEVFDELLLRDVVSWNVLIAGFAQLGQFKRVFSLLTKMIVEGIMPNVVTFVVILIACSHAGLVEEGEICFDAMNTVYCLTPTLEHYSCMVDLFSRLGQFHKAILTIEKVSPSIRPQLWSTLLGACQKLGYVDLGRSVFEHLIRLDEDNSALYVCMSNIYAA